MGTKRSDSYNWKRVRWLRSNNSSAYRVFEKKKCFYRKKKGTTRRFKQISARHLWDSARYAAGKKWAYFVSYWTPALALRYTNISGKCKKRVIEEAAERFSLVKEINRLQGLLNKKLVRWVDLTHGWRGKTSLQGGWGEGDFRANFKSAWIGKRLVNMKLKASYQHQKDDGYSRMYVHLRK